MITKLAVWYLRKTKKSVLIGFLIHKGSIQQKNNKAFLYDNNLMNTVYYTSNGNELNLPKEKFSYKEGDPHESS